MTREEAETIILKHQFAFASMPDDVIEAINYLVKEEPRQLKADLVAILTEIQTEIEDVPRYCMTHDCICVYRRAEEYMSDVNNVIQKKIDALKPESEEEK